MKGQDVPVAMSQIRVVVVPGKTTAENWSEENSQDFQFISSGLWAAINGLGGVEEDIR